MTVKIYAGAEDDLEEAFDHYEAARRGLGVEFVVEFRHAVEFILRYPRGWQRLDNKHRRYRLKRFPYGIVYWIDEASRQIVIVAIVHLSRGSDEWRKRVS